MGASESHPGILPPRPTFFRVNGAPLGGLERKVADMQARDIAWTPDSKALAVSAEVDGNIRVVLLLLETREARFLTSPPKQGYSFGDLYSAISPDGLSLAFARIPEGGTTEFHLNCDGEQTCAPRLAADSRSISLLNLSLV